MADVGGGWEASLSAVLQQAQLGIDLSLNAPYIPTAAPSYSEMSGR